jgi:hypothetical protein
MMLEVQLVDAWPAPALIKSSRIRSSERQMMERILSTACGFDCADLELKSGGSKMMEVD